MLVVTCVKQVPDTTQVQTDPVTGNLIRKGIPSIMNPYDTHALEESLKLKEKYGLRVVVLSMGPPSAKETLKKALAVGADEVILLSDRLFGGSDTLATSNVISEAIRKLSQEDEIAAVLCGRQTIDGDTAQVGPGIATRLRYSQLTLVDSIEELNIEKKNIKVSRKLRGLQEIVEATLPAVITVVREINHLRYPTVPMRLMSEKTEIAVWNNQIMGLDEESIGTKGSATQVRKIFSPEKTKGMILGDGLREPEKVADLLISKLVERGLIAL